MVDIDEKIGAMSVTELNEFVESIKQDPEMARQAIEVSVAVMAEFIGRNDLQDQLVDEIDPNQMVALIVATEILGVGAGE